VLVAKYKKKKRKVPSDIYRGQKAGYLTIDHASMVIYHNHNHNHKPMIGFSHYWDSK